MDEPTLPGVLDAPTVTVAIDHGASALPHPQQHYTGVVVVHGLGDIKRNITLQEALDSLTYWFSYKAGLALRPTGPGRVWLTPELTDNPDPDAPPSRATLELEAPTDPKGQGDNDILRLEWREVWWAESFGLPSIAATFKWAITQGVEQVRYLLIPLGGPGQTAAQSPARRVRQATTYRPSTPDATEPLKRSSVPLRAALWLYDSFQHLFKACQWLILTPLVLTLLLVMSVVRVLVFVPFLKLGVIATISGILDYIMLHWIASTQVYMQEYTRASAIRERFEREVRALLSDQNCDHVVVIAHSMGTVIAYEGLTTVLGELELQARASDVTFICLAQALRRIWLLKSGDVHRVHEVLPDKVRWLHFWARYDPVTAGPLLPTALPPIAASMDADQQDRLEKLAKRLEDCENVDVVNTDSTFLDHGSYWQNLEQVVGPIARELVVGHPRLEQAVEAHLAEPEEVLARRADIAWRATAAMTAGLAAGTGVVTWAVTHRDFGKMLVDALRLIPLRDLIISLVPALGLIAKANLPDLSHNQTLQDLEAIGRQNALAYLLLQLLTVERVAVAGLALLLTAVVTLAVGRLVQPPTPFAYPDPIATRAGRLGPLFWLCALGIVCVGIAAFIFTLVSTGVKYQNYSTTTVDQPAVLTYVWVLGAGELCYSLAYILVIGATLLRRQWGWSAGIALAVVLAATYDPFIRSSLLFVAVVGLLVSFRVSLQARRLGQSLAIATILVLTVYASVGAIVFGSSSPLTGILGGGTAVEYLLPLLIYTLWSGLLRPGAQERISIPQQGAVLLVPLTLLLLMPLAIQHLYIPSTTQKAFTPASVASLPDLFGSNGLGQFTVIGVGVDGAVILALLLMLFSVVDAVRAHRWGWLALMLLILGGLVAWQSQLLAWGVKTTLPNAAYAAVLFLLAAALIYVLWASPPQVPFRPTQSVLNKGSALTAGER